jgi:hypothetical protein
MMNLSQIGIAERQLDRVLQFASRIESKISMLLATDLGIVAIMLINLNFEDIKTWYISIPLFAGMLAISQSIFYIYKAAYPNLEGGSSSLIYFSEIAKRTEQAFLRDFRDLSLDDLYCDIVGQIWRNSQIMSQKFESLRKAFLFTVLSTVPWAIFLIASSVTHSRSIMMK